MSIHFKKDNKIIQINTENSMYQMQIDKYDRLIHLYYGKITGDDNLDYLIQKYDRGFSPNPTRLETIEHIHLMYFRKNIQVQITGTIEFAAWKFAIKM